jgi:hypothetical protein
MASASETVKPTTSLANAGFRFSIKQLLLAVTFVAVGLVSLLNAWPWVASTVTTVVPVLLTMAILWAFFSCEERRALWIGFAVCGWSYFLCLFSSSISIGPSYGPPGYVYAGQNSRLPQLLVYYAHQKLFPDSWPSVAPTYTPPSYIPSPLDPTADIDGEPAGTIAIPQKTTYENEEHSEVPSSGADMPPSLDPPRTVPIVRPPSATPSPAPPFVVNILKESPSLVDFYNVAQSFFTIMVAWAGGVYSAFLFRRRA